MRVAIPESAHPRLRLLFAEHRRAKAVLALYVQGIMAGMGLDTSWDWNLDTQTMTLEGEPTPEVSLAAQT